ncbi:hypothetical protein [Leucobacter chromiireducens]|uniref:Alkaline shock response membrane anchor protein AmaP n=1 Tax=Leucobacter chromiireducens subsp. solipictus TaxID=398235 RepID=A0ABS1SGI4_9MICO|nr:hypothetical protein [Leucobacter chromiireducens]MBL3678991.1 hypothetical protein [Leucobacter chromiireducens subsp. solipictus]
MTELSAVYRRVLRRETHASRTAPAVVVVCVVLVTVGVAVWGIFDPRLRDGVGAAIRDLPLAPAAVVAVGAALLLLGFLLLGAGVLPGRNSRRQRTSGRLAVLCDASVLANAVADGVALRCELDRSQARVSVGKRAVAVHVTPTSGVALDADSVRRAAEAVLEDAGFPGTVRVSLASRGVIA